MKAKLFRSGVDKGEPVTFAAEAAIGRGADNSLRLEDASVSNRHARIYFDAERGRYYLEDLGSLNGTKLDGIEIARAEQLDRLHVIEFGDAGLEFVFQAVDLSPAGAEAAETEEVGSGTAVDQEMPELPASLADDSAAATEPPGEGTAADREMPAVPEALLDDLEGEETLPVPVEHDPKEEAGDAAPTAEELGPVAGEAPFYLKLHEPPDSEPIPLVAGSHVLGRARAADISVESPSVSRRHALISVGDTVTVRDLGSRNHTFVDDVRIEDEVPIELGSEIRFGDLPATLIPGVPPK